MTHLEYIYVRVWSVTSSFASFTKKPERFKMTVHGYPEIPILHSIIDRQRKGLQPVLSLVLSRSIDQ